MISVDKTYILFDLEATVNADHDVIEIGACRLCFQNSHFSVADSFHTYVRPVCCNGRRKTYKLTGIDLKELKTAPEFPDALQAFLDWAGEESVFVSWGCNDEQFLENECRRQGIAMPDMSFMDLQAVYDQQFHHPFCTKLTSAIEECDGDFIGTPHTASADASNLLLLFNIIHAKQRVSAVRADNALPCFA